ncbi:MAG: DUF423 domain-containing protein [Verrucomicrobia bacterium]|nr:DUF423 domain-containing protein [Verrucomicrobiota bacterium]
MNVQLARKLTAILGFLGVLFGAFGAHALRARLDAAGTTSSWQTGVLYHLLHAVALLAVTSRPSVSRLTFWSFFFGIVVFSGSLYLLALTTARWLGAITPLGGLGMLLGWLSLLFSRRDDVP